MRIRPINWLLALTVLTLAGTGTAAPAVAQTVEPRGVVELFTSQGCSSCPPADAILGKLAKRDDVIALTLAVDYWDYLGWKDTFADPENTARQRAYAQRWKGQGVYTPQAVVNGMAHVVGSREADIERALADTAAKFKSHGIKIDSRLDNTDLVIGLTPSAQGNSQPSAGTIVLLSVLKNGEVAIGRGENGGRSVMYSNVVRKLSRVGKWEGRPLTVRVDAKQCRQKPIDFCVVLVHQGTAGPIMAAARVVAGATAVPTMQNAQPNDALARRMPPQDAVGVTDRSK